MSLSFSLVTEELWQSLRLSQTQKPLLCCGVYCGFRFPEGMGGVLKGTPLCQLHSHGSINDILSPTTQLLLGKPPNKSASCAKGTALQSQSFWKPEQLLRRPVSSALELCSHLFTYKNL